MTAIELCSLICLLVPQMNPPDAAQQPQGLVAVDSVHDWLDANPQYVRAKPAPPAPPVIAKTHPSQSRGLGVAWPGPLPTDDRWWYQVYKNGCRSWGGRPKSFAEWQLQEKRMKFRQQMFRLDTALWKLEKELRWLSRPYSPGYGYR